MKTAMGAAIEKGWEIIIAMLHKTTSLRINKPF